MLHGISGPIPILATTRLTLRALEEQDAPAVFRLRSNPDVMRFIPKPLNTRVEESLRMIQEFRKAGDQGDSVMWGITIQGFSQVMGYIGFWRMIREQDSAEIGYALHPDLWGQGLMAEALEAVLRFGFGEMGLLHVEAQVTPENNASIHVLERCGFVRNKRQHTGIPPGDDLGDAVVFTRAAP